MRIQHYDMKVQFKQFSLSTKILDEPYKNKCFGSNERKIKIFTLNGRQQYLLHLTESFFDSLFPKLFTPI